MKDSECVRSERFADVMRAVRLEGSTGPPDTLESALLKHFRRHHARNRTWRAAVALSGVAAALLLTVALSTQMRRPQSQVTLPVPPRPQPVQPAAGELPRAISQVPKRARVVQPVHRVRPKSKAVDAFIAIPYAEPLNATEPVSVYRVEMPRATLARFGVPLSPETLNTTVTADVATGEDGVARAIRFVHY